MKQFSLLLAAFVLTAFPAFAQNSGLNAFIDNHKNDKGFIHAFLSKDLFEVVSNAEVKDQDWKKLHNVVSNFGSLSILAADHISNSQELYKEARGLVSEDAFDELLTVRDGQDNVRIWSKSEDNVITDLVLLVGSTEEFVLICFAGTFELTNLGELAKMFDAESAGALAKTAEQVTVDFQISPNPNNGDFKITYDNPADHPAQLSLIDQNGRQVITRSLTGGPKQSVTVQEIPSGIYWVQIKTEQGRIGIKQVQIVKK